MNTQAVTLLKADSVNLTNISDDTRCEESFEKLMQKINEEKDIEEMKQFLNKKFNVTIIVSDYSCETTDSKAENYDLFMLDKYDMHGARNVVISRKSLLRMKKDSIFRQKVYKSIEDLGCTSNMTGGIVKSTGVFIHEDGTGGYWTEFDWGDEEDNKKKPVNFLSDEKNRIDIELHGYEENSNENFETQIALLGSLSMQDRRKRLAAAQ